MKEVTLQQNENRSLKVTVTSPQKVSPLLFTVSPIIQAQHQFGKEQP